MTVLSAQVGNSDLTRQIIRMITDPGFSRKTFTSILNCLRRDYPGLDQETLRLHLTFMHLANCGRAEANKVQEFIMDTSAEMRNKVFRAIIGQDAETAASNLQLLAAEGVVQSDMTVDLPAEPAPAPQNKKVVPVKHKIKPIKASTPVKAKKRRKNRGYRIVTQVDVINLCTLVRSTPGKTARFYGNKTGIPPRAIVHLLHRFRLAKVNLDVPRQVKYLHQNTEGEFVPAGMRKKLLNKSTKFVPKQVYQGLQRSQPKLSPTITVTDVGSASERSCCGCSSQPVPSKDAFTLKLEMTFGNAFDFEKYVKKLAAI